MDNFEVRWLQLEIMLRERFGKVPDLQGILFLIGINELDSFPKDTYTKEQKQDLMHIAVCKLLSSLNYYEFTGRDEDGWPHFEAVKVVEVKGITEQEHMLKECIINYFNS